MLGPLIRAQVGDTVRIHFRNRLSIPASIHAHGLRYAKNAEGAPYADGTSGAPRANSSSGAAEAASGTHNKAIPQAYKLGV